MNYRVEKDGESFYVQDYQVQWYAQNGYKIYKPVEVLVTDIDSELKNSENNNIIWSSMEGSNEVKQ